MRESAIQLATSLQEEARTILSELSYLERENYASLVRALSDRYDHSQPPEFYRMQLKRRKRGSKESITDLSNELRTLVNRAHPGMVAREKEEKTLQYFFDALHDVDLEWTLFQKRPQNLAEAIQVVQEYEMFNQGRKSQTYQQQRN